MAARRRSRGWIDRHVNDPYVQRAQREGYRSRAAYKLIELDDKDRLLRPGLRVADLGAAPGGWSQVAAERCGPRGAVVAIDLLSMDPIAGVEVVQGDFREEPGCARLIERLGGDGVDLVLSDMAPNVSGMPAVDQPRMMHLVELTLDFALRLGKPGGAMAVKAFQGEGFDAALREIRSRFERVVIRKPQASRATSRELYVVAKGRRLA